MHAERDEDREHYDPLWIRAGDSGTLRRMTDLICPVGGEGTLPATERCFVEERGLDARLDAVHRPDERMRGMGWS